MNPFYSNMKPWWLAFIAAWLVVAVVLTQSGMNSNSAVRVALVAASGVALLVWAIYRRRERPRG